MAQICDLNTRNFLRNLSKYENTYFVTPWAGVVVHNCDSSGNLIQHSTTHSYIRSKIPFWIFLKVKLFRDDEGIKGAYVCHTCQSMTALPMMTMDQRRTDIENLLCLHSIAAAHKTDGREMWGLPVITPETLSHQFQPGLDTKISILVENDLFLAAVQKSGDVKLIFTLSKRNKSPFCSHCSTQKCKHYKQYVEVKNQQRNANLNDSNNTNNSVETNSDEENPSATLPDHYDDIEPLA